MKTSKYTLQAGKWLMQKGRLKIVIADDEAAYFTPKMIAAARHAGYCGITRIMQINHAELQKLLQNPPDIIILDVGNVCPKDVAKDGIDLARVFSRDTSAMVVLTSAHKFHLRGAITHVDYIIENRKLTAVDFVNEIALIVDKYLAVKSKFYKAVLFKIGVRLVKAGTAQIG